MLTTVLTVSHILLTISLIGLVLIQRGKGADMGAAFGSGASATMFGSQGSASFLTRTTAAIATLFFVTSMSLAYFSGQRVEHKSVTEMEQMFAPSVEIEADTPVVPSDKPDNMIDAADVPADQPVAPMEMNKAPSDKPDMPTTGE